MKRILFCFFAILFAVSCTTQTHLRSNESDSINASPNAEQEKVPIKIEKYTVTADDKGIYPYQTFVDENSSVEITFVISEWNTKYKGLDVKSDVFGSLGTINAGENKTVRFTATKPFDFKTYYPSDVKTLHTGSVILN